MARSLNAMIKSYTQPFHPLYAYAILPDGWKEGDAVPEAEQPEWWPINMSALDTWQDSEYNYREGRRARARDGLAARRGEERVWSSPSVVNASDAMGEMAGAVDTRRGPVRPPSPNASDHGAALMAPHHTACTRFPSPPPSYPNRTQLTLADDKLVQTLSAIGATTHGDDMLENKKEFRSYIGLHPQQQS